jgi:hypothetical protein
MTTQNPQVKPNMTEEDWGDFSLWLKDMLKVGPVTVTFTKKDGTVRVMECTLDSNLIPPAPVTEGAEPKKKKTVNENTMAVYDLEAKAWRSFTIRAVSRVQLKL